MFIPRFNIFIPVLVRTGLDQFGPVYSGSGPVFLDLEISRTGPGSGSAKKGERTRTGPDF